MLIFPEMIQNINVLIMEIIIIIIIMIIVNVLHTLLNNNYTLTYMDSI